MALNITVVRPDPPLTDAEKIEFLKRITPLLIQLDENGYQKKRKLEQEKTKKNPED